MKNSIGILFFTALMVIPFFSAQAQRHRPRRAVHTCYADNHRGYQFTGISNQRYIARDRALRRCQYNSRRPYTCRVNYCRKRYTRRYPRHPRGPKYPRGPRRPY